MTNVVSLCTLKGGRIGQVIILTNVGPLVVSGLVKNGKLIEADATKPWGNKRGTTLAIRNHAIKQASEAFAMVTAAL